MAKQVGNTRLDVLAAAGLKPKEDATPLKIPVSAPERTSNVSEPQIEHVESVDTRPGGRPLKSDEEKATEKVTAYFTPEQYDHIEELQRAYRKRTKKRISVNELLRRLVTTANIEDILPRP
jgi:hypothetical protein